MPIHSADQLQFIKDIQISHAFWNVEMSLQIICKHVTTCQNACDIAYIL